MDKEAGTRKRIFRKRRKKVESNRKNDSKNETKDDVTRVKSVKTKKVDIKKNWASKTIAPNKRLTLSSNFGIFGRGKSSIAALRNPEIETLVNADLDKILKPDRDQAGDASSQDDNLSMSDIYFSPKPSKTSATCSKYSKQSENDTKVSKEDDILTATCVSLSGDNSVLAEYLDPVVRESSPKVVNKCSEIDIEEVLKRREIVTELDHHLSGIDRSLFSKHDPYAESLAVLAKLKAKLRVTEPKFLLESPRQMIEEPRNRTSSSNQLFEPDFISLLTETENVRNQHPSSQHSSARQLSQNNDAENFIFQPSHVVTPPNPTIFNEIFTQNMQDLGTSEPLIHSSDYDSPMSYVSPTGQVATDYAGSFDCQRESCCDRKHCCSRRSSQESYGGEGPSWQVRGGNNSQEAYGGEGPSWQVRGGNNSQEAYGGEGTSWQVRGGNNSQDYISDQPTWHVRGQKHSRTWSKDNDSPSPGFKFTRHPLI